MGLFVTPFNTNIKDKCSYKNEKAQVWIVFFIGEIGTIMVQTSKSALPALGSIVQYDEAVAYELQHPVTGEGLGVHFTLTSSGSDAVRAVVKKQMRSNMASRAGQGVMNIDAAVKMTEERLAASIASWDFGGRELIEGQGVPEFTHENKLILVRVDWIFDQLSKQVNNLENFTKG